MRSRSLLTTAAAAIILVLSASTGFAQDAAVPAQKPQATEAKPAESKPNLLAQLGLSKDQMQQIRALNVERKPLMVAAQNRLRAANLSLDSAIYADAANDVDIEFRVKELQAAQSEVIRIRSANELAVRRVLTPEQLVRFREIRQKFDEVRRQLQTRRKARQAVKAGTTIQTPNMFKRRGGPI
ncbi:MAG: hypothetical protein ABJA02_14665 [Acidobacteriota bacterium]